MSLPDVVSRDEWLTARKALLTREKALTKERDALNADRRRLPMVRVEKEYEFDGPDGKVTLGDLFEGRLQLIVQHFMFGPDWESGCPSCTGAVDEMSPGLIAHLGARETTYAIVSRAPLEKLEAYRKERGWEFPWYSSYGTDFNYDFHVTLDESVAPVEYNYRAADELADRGMNWLLEPGCEMPGFSVFLRDGDAIYHTYSTYARGTDGLGGGYAYLDLTALGRQEEWEEPKGRAEAARPAVPDFAP